MPCYCVWVAPVLFIKQLKLQNQHHVEVVLSTTASKVKNKPTFWTLFTVLWDIYSLYVSFNVWMPFLSLQQQSAVNIHVKTNILNHIASCSTLVFLPLLLPFKLKQRSDVLLLFLTSANLSRDRQPRAVGSEVRHKLQRCFSVFLSCWHTHTLANTPLFLSWHTFSHTCAHSCRTAAWSTRRNKKNPVAYLSDMHLWHTHTHMHTLWATLELPPHTAGFFIHQ